MKLKVNNDVYALIRDAIVNRRQVTAQYDNYYREMCPHALGTKRGHQHALFFQFAGESSRGLPPGGMWRCMDLSALQNVRVRDGEWHTGTRHSRPQNCIDHVEYEVEY
jgi:hypothetical protein